MMWILLVIAALAGLAACIYSILFVVQIFSTSGPIWGIACLLISPVSFIWLILNWDAGKDPFLKSLGYSVISTLFAVGASAFAQ